MWTYNVLVSFKIIFILLLIAKFALAAIIFKRLITKRTFGDQTVILA